MVGSNGRQDDRLESLELEFNLLKTEIRQTLIDVKEFVMKGRSVNPAQRPEPARSVVETPTPTPTPTPEVVADESPADLLSEEGINWEPSDLPAASTWDSIPSAKDTALALNNMNDATMMKNIIWWLGTARRRGITLGQLSPFIEAYEMSGYMSPLVSKLIYKTMAHLADEEATPSGQQMPQDFSDGLMQLNEIITVPGFDIQDKSLTPDQLSSGNLQNAMPETVDDWGNVNQSS
jgi:hypothetical protein